MLPRTSRYYLLQLAPGAPDDPIGDGTIRIASRIPPDLAIGESSSDTPLVRVIESLASSGVNAGVVGELIPTAPSRPDGLSVVTAVTLPIATVFYLLVPGVRSDFRDFILLLLAAPILLLSGIPIIVNSARALRHAVLRPSLFHLAGAVGAYVYGVSQVLADANAGRGGRYFLYALTLAALPVLYRLGPSLARTVFFRWVVPSSQPAYVEVEENGSLHRVPTYQLKEGMIIILREGATVPVECVVRNGECTADYLGLPDTVHLSAGDMVHAGINICEGEIHAEVIHVPDTRIVEASTRLRLAGDEAQPYYMAMNLMSALAVLVVMAAVMFQVQADGHDWFRSVVAALVITGALPLESVDLLGRLTDVLFADLAAARGILLDEKTTPAALAGIASVHTSPEDSAEKPPAGVSVVAGGPFVSGEAAVVRTLESADAVPGNVIKVYAGPRENAPRQAVVLLTQRAGEFWSFLEGALKVRRAGLLAYVFSLTLGGAAAFLAAVGILQVYAALVFGALAALWAEIILASASTE
ncbi:MAG: hypothetical protein JW909_12200 [Planctomycetes bacterium]|nr:hypothetical protein [Planctomycetota bacterium]